MSPPPTRIRAADLHAFCVTAMLECGLSEADARTTAEALVTTDTWGIYTHGTISLRQYLRRTRAGGQPATAKPEIVGEGPAWAIVDGHSAMGMVTGCMAMQTAIQKARSCGIGYVGV